MARPAANLTAHFAPTPVSTAPGSAGREEAIWRPTTSRRLVPTSARQHRLAGKLVLHFVIMGSPLRGTEGSNPAPSSGESVANLTADDLMLNTTGPGSSRR